MLFQCSRITSRHYQTFGQVRSEILPDTLVINRFSKPYFDALKRVNILHDDPASAAKFINKNWDNIEEWWNKKETQEALVQFKNNYAMSSKNWKIGWIEAIQELC